ncbi:zonular occludens toxin domain-containing protein [Burkholderia latens]|uniref:zonular occludens toxin domain-containing protein n=1 Tax=Burkholderia latens TaxID=488446 RepID=UPI001AEB5CD0|nr:zonular occludens toxin domain-containing protein [Burkholderia latens]QTO42805.1 Zonular occludens toxin [Burkholderia latens]QTO46513.1 Zonular occludens toxin [Burkholderia latens]
MAINAYCGVMGSGKSYEVVSGPLIEAVARGRRVVTNIDGVSEDAIHRYLHERRGLAVDSLGAIVHVRTDDILQDGFFPVEVEGAGGATVTPGFVKPGDLLVVDEAWKLWSVGKKISSEHMSFFRMHRHFVHEETGVACDVVLMIQSIADLHRSIKAVVELSFRMVKLKSLGMSGGYRVEMYETSKQTKATQTGTFIRKYKAEIFPLYKSYAGAGGTESAVDKRQNVLARKSLWLLVAGVVVMMGCAGFFAWRFFHPTLKRDPVIAAPMGGAVGQSVASKPVGAAVSESWRVVGNYTVNGLARVVLADATNRLRVVSPGGFMGRGLATAGVVDGERVTTWAGPKLNVSVAFGATK